jgi:plasmid stabilization system protein ParE
MNKKYTLRYLPLFEQDLASVRDYISQNLQNPVAAHNLLEDTEKAIQKRVKNPLGYMPYPSNHDRAYKYYRINIKNYSIFYVVIGDVMEVRRFIFSRRDISSII